ncbi:putative SAF domain protein [Desulfosarcina cetonica]|uniref:flagellar basal body P-ring formation chaperone FlgA n=1 Tax=Desulfosarcina cetonica TaxID=90730 RepID=UPI0012ED8875|nr:flagellar basal body P-ring formation chaperone FlgA [Desulfosarcina cetonica]VTR65251.1 putative SAF domain protein [Desulfosarcina cetonica]
MRQWLKRIIWSSLFFIVPAITWAGQIPVDQINNAVQAAIRQHMPWKNEDVTIGPIHFNDTLNLPNGRLTFQIVPTPNEDFIGRTILALHLFVDGQPIRRIWVNTTISVMANVVTVVRPLGKSQPIQFGDLALTRRDLKDLPSDALRQMNAAVGQRTTCTIYPNTVLQARMMESQPLVRRGDRVKIVAQSGNLTITATGLVKQKGAKDEVVRVVNTASNRVIAARVKGPGLVEVDF